MQFDHPSFLLLLLMIFEFYDSSSMASRSLCLFLRAAAAVMSL